MGFLKKMIEYVNVRGEQTGIEHGFIPLLRGKKTVRELPDEGYLALDQDSPSSEITKHIRHIPSPSSFILKSISFILNHIKIR